MDSYPRYLQKELKQISDCHAAVVVLSAKHSSFTTIIHTAGCISCPESFATPPVFIEKYVTAADLCKAVRRGYCCRTPARTPSQHAVAVRFRP